jgi:hypothetical protein
MTAADLDRIACAHGVRLLLERRFVADAVSRFR